MALYHGAVLFVYAIVASQDGLGECLTPEVFSVPFACSLSLVEDSNKRNYFLINTWELSFLGLD